MSLAIDCLRALDISDRLGLADEVGEIVFEVN